MRAIILAAGMGRRLKPLTNNAPKCLLEINRRPIFIYQIEALYKCGINKITVVAGHKSAEIEKLLIACDLPNVEIIINPFYRITNSIASLWFARKYCNEDLIILNSDVLFDYKILAKLLAKESELSFAVDQKKCDDEAYKVAVKEDRIVWMGKRKPTSHKIFGEFIGMAKVSGSMTLRLFDVVCTSVSKELYTNWFESAFKYMVEHHGFPLDYVLTDGLYWTEIDTKEDLKNARAV